MRWRPVPSVRAYDAGARAVDRLVRADSGHADRRRYRDGVERTTNVRARVGAAVRTVAVVGSFAVAVVFLDASAAAAHTASGPRPTNYRSTIESVSPRIPGVTVRIVDLGNLVELTNTTGTDVTVLGYYQEPYLRVGPGGVYENLRSPATYLNRTRAGDTAIPAIAKGTGASTPPQWHRVSGSRTVRWHDHRVHWMGTSPPAAVRAAPGAHHTINPEWTVVYRYGARDVVVHGRLDWVPGPSGRPWVPFVLVLFGVGLLVTRRRSRAALIGAVVGLVAIDAAHAVAGEVSRAGSVAGKTLQFFGDDWVSLIVWVLAGFTVWAVGRTDAADRASGSAPGRPEAYFGVLLVGAMVALTSGVTDLAYLWKSQLPTIGPDVVARAEVAAVLGLGLGLATGAFVRIIRSAPQRAAPARDPEWLERLVAGLDDDAIALQSSRLDAAEVVPRALSDLADRLAPAATDLGTKSLVFVVLAQDDVGLHEWSIVAAPLGTSGLRVQRGRPAPARAEVRATFPAFLGLLGGALTLAGAISAGRLVVDGDRAFVTAIEPYLSTARRPQPVVHGQ
jgi:hypothetical protein